MARFLDKYYGAHGMHYGLPFILSDIPYEYLKSQKEYMLNCCIFGVAISLAAGNSAQSLTKCKAYHIETTPRDDSLYSYQQLMPHIMIDI